MIKPFASLVALSLLASCSAGPPRMPLERIDRVLADAPGAAQPGKIVAREIEFSRAARENGQWTAFRAFMAPGALIHGQSGAIDADQWLATQADPPEAVQWAARSVWMSCDGRLAVSRGRFRDPDGRIGTFVTIWQQQADRSYKWVYDSGALDDPQPDGQLADDGAGIIVSADEIIQGYVADCPGSGGAAPDNWANLRPAGTQSGGAQSPDGTLHWSWYHYPNGGRSIEARYLVDGQWETALDERFPAPESQ
jgi:hypothetical protein